MREFKDNLLMRISRRRFALGRDFKGLREQRITGEDGNPFAEDLMIR